MLNKKNLSTLTKVIDCGYTDEKQIVGITAKEMTVFCKKIEEVLAVCELQEAIQQNKLLAYLTAE